ncbi:hypothetical protein BGAL_0152g00250 [Botrytis galanthina]|uniref:Uncharacterized protein n=1 Tax=Botrytis galanthina TaxID=278940 RepID=A0A4S8R1J1_9HELO|nr:hypothetical protein BGAL_0152g00250 [Botrytis galanthina]
MLNEDPSGPSTNFGSGKFDALEISRASFVATWSQMFLTPAYGSSTVTLSKNITIAIKRYARGRQNILAEDHFMHQPPMFKTSEAMEVKPST